MGEQVPSTDLCSQLRALTAGNRLLGYTAAELIEKQERDNARLEELLRIAEGMHDRCAACAERLTAEPKSGLCNAVWLGCELPVGHEGKHRCGSAVWNASPEPRDGQ